MRHQKRFESKGSGEIQQRAGSAEIQECKVLERFTILSVLDTFQTEVRQDIQGKRYDEIYEKRVLRKAG